MSLRERSFYNAHFVFYNAHFVTSHVFIATATLRMHLRCERSSSGWCGDGQIRWQCWTSFDISSHTFRTIRRRPRQQPPIQSISAHPLLSGPLLTIASYRTDTTRFHHISSTMQPYSNSSTDLRSSFERLNSDPVPRHATCNLSLATLLSRSMNASGGEANCLHQQNPTQRWRGTYQTLVNMRIIMISTCKKQTPTVTVDNIMQPQVTRRKVDIVISQL